MKKNIFQIVGLFLLLPLFAGCNDSDDITAIFTGKTWKLNYITEDGGHEMFNFWGSDNVARTKSYEELEKNASSYNIVFDGIAEEDIIHNGTIRGNVIKSFSLEGSWNANGKDNSFKASVTGNDGGDVLAKNFLEGLNAATSYEGDTNGNLYLIYKGGQRTFRMVFRVVNK